MTKGLKPRFALLTIVGAIAMAAFAPSAGAGTVILNPCSAGAIHGFGAWGNSYTQWRVQTRCDSEVELSAAAGETLGPIGAYYQFPAYRPDHGTIAKVEFDWKGGGLPGSGLLNVMRVCKTSVTNCSGNFSPANPASPLLEHVELQAGRDFPTGDDYLFLIGGCTTAPATACSPGPELIIRNLKVTFEDDIAPEISPSTEETYNPNVAPLLPLQPIDPSATQQPWNGGTRKVRMHGTDKGTGIKFFTFEMHAADQERGIRWREGLWPEDWPSVPEYKCGEPDYAAEVPYLCDASAESEFAAKLYQAGFQWAMVQGLNHMRISAVDAAGNESKTYEFDFLMDNLRPRLNDLTVTPERSTKWQPNTRIGLSWTNTGEDFETASESGVAYAKWTVEPQEAGMPPGLSGTEPSSDGHPVDSVPIIDVPGPGRWRVSLTTYDRAGNASLTAYEYALIDATIPAAPTIADITTASAAELASDMAFGWTAPANVAAISSGICGYAMSVDQNPASDPGTLINIAGAATSAVLPAVLNNGENWLHLRAISCSGVAGAIDNEQFTVDALAPQLSISQPGPGGWYSTTAPLLVELAGGAESGAKISATVDAPIAEWTNQSSIAVSLPDGTHDVYLQTRDAGGNKSLQLLKVKSDSTKPAVSFAAFDPARPTRVKAVITDQHSGVAAAALMYRRASGGDWEPLGEAQQPQAEGGNTLELNARFPDDSLPAGVYELRAVATDVARQSNSVTTRPDGAPATLNLPLRAAGSLSAGFTSMAYATRCKGKGKKRTCRRVAAKHAKSVVSDVTLVNYGGSKQILGTLRNAAGDPVAGGQIEVFQAIGSAPRTLINSMATDSLGRFAYTPNPGPSRRITFRYSGSETDAPAEAVVKFLSRSGVELTVKRKRIAGGWNLTFRGHVSADGAYFPRSGKTIAPQFKTRGGWHVLQNGVVADQLGNFQFVRKFKSGDAVKYNFRAEVPWVDGWVYETGTSNTVVTVLR